MALSRGGGVRVGFCGWPLSLSCFLHSGVLSSIGKIFKEEGLLGFFVYVSLYPS